MASKKKAAAPAPAAEPVAQDAKQAKGPSVEDRLTAVEKALADHVALAARNGWSV